MRTAALIAVLGAAALLAAGAWGAVDPNDSQLLQDASAQFPKNGHVTVASSKALPRRATPKPAGRLGGGGIGI
jgi:hypothetical protein